MLLLTRFARSAAIIIIIIIIIPLQACAPRYIQLEHYVKITLRWLLGRCLLLKKDLSGHLNRNWILNPCENGMNLYLFTWQF